MRIAVILYGEPRFCKEFDLFLERLKGYDQADYFIHIWGKSQSVSNYHRTRGSILVAEPWQNVDREWALNKLRTSLPANSNVVDLTLGDQSAVPIPDMPNRDAETNLENMWKMYYSLNNASKSKRKYEQDNGFEYDLAIVVRPDIMLQADLDLGHIKHHVDKDAKLISMPDNSRCGYGVAVSDMIAISSSKNIDAYCDLYNQAAALHDSGVIFHPETLLGNYLNHNSFTHYGLGYNISIRSLGTRISVQEYISDFGSWA